MAEIVQNEASVQGAFSAVGSLLDFLVNYWWVILLICVIIVLVVLVFMFYVAKEDNDRKRDSVVYATAQSIKESAETNVNKDWVKKTYSLKNLFWLGLPFKKNEHSMKIIDMDRNLLGYYRGHTRTQEGDIVFLLYKHKRFFIMEDKFLLYCPLKIDVPEKADFVGDSSTVLKTQELPKDTVDFDIQGWEIRIKCNTISKLSNYYYFPNYILRTVDGIKFLDMSDYISKQIAKTNYVRVMESGFSDMGRAMSKAVEINPFLKYGQKEPEKEREIDDDQIGRR